MVSGAVVVMEEEVSTDHPTTHKISRTSSLPRQTLQIPTPTVEAEVEPNKIRVPDTLIPLLMGSANPIGNLAVLRFSVVAL